MCIFYYPPILRGEEVMSFGKNILKYQNDIIKDIGELIKIPSVASESSGGMPYGENAAKALKWILSRASEMGFDAKNIGNYVGHAQYGNFDQFAAVLTHLDVVPAGDGWETDPFELVQKDGKLFGRGIVDNKGAAIIALYCLKVLKEENIQGTKSIRTIFGCGEECGMKDMEKYFSEEKFPVMAFTPDSEYGICNQEKGILQLEITAPSHDGTTLTEFHAGNVVNAVPDKAYALLDCTENEDHQLQRLADAKKGEYEFCYTIDGMKIVSYGKAAHAAEPEKGFNAAMHLIRLLASNFGHKVLGSICGFLDATIGLELHGSSMRIKKWNTVSDELTINVGCVDIGPKHACAKIDIRYPHNTNKDLLIETVKQRAEKEGLSINILSHIPPLFIDKDFPIISILKDAYKEITDTEADLFSSGGGTYARRLNGTGVAFGPVFKGYDTCIHKPNENIDINKLMLHAQICLEAMYRMITTD